MAIIHNADTRDTVDSDTGEYLRIGPTHWQDPYLHCVIHHADGTPLFSADVERHAVDETGDSGGATLVHYIVRKAWVPPSKPARLASTHTNDELIAKLRTFLEARQRSRKSTPDPRFEFSDERISKR